mmetsp:Transcript_17194/g.37564  ORF Transcript_17194/g.37564 Transcript_17194/m.37564 type:complete len:208 (-) Transcript_17194:650-1273(-)
MGVITTASRTSASNSCSSGYRAKSSSSSSSKTTWLICTSPIIKVARPLAAAATRLSTSLLRRTSNSTRCNSDRRSCSARMRCASASAWASSLTLRSSVSALNVRSSAASMAPSSSTNRSLLKLNSSLPDSTDSPLPPFFLDCSCFSLTSASYCLLASLAARHLVNVSSVIGVPLRPSAASRSLCSSMMSSIVFSLNTCTATGSSTST